MNLVGIKKLVGYGNFKNNTFSLKQVKIKNQKLKAKPSNFCFFISCCFSKNLDQKLAVLSFFCFCVAFFVR